VRVQKTVAQSSITVVITLILTFLQPAYANGGHVHLGGVFFLLLGSVVFIGGLVVVFYFLLRPNPDEMREAANDD
jgi:Kef-type K+ transport system membrane component KefB